MLGINVLGPCLSHLTHDRRLSCPIQPTKAERLQQLQETTPRKANLRLQRMSVDLGFR
jgi:hypothetical protein